MDNLSHSVAGLAVGELIQRSLAPEPEPAAQALRRRMLLFTCWGASNLPDLDLVLKGLLPAPLGYLLHHRGHTHTLLFAIPQALLLMGLVWLLWPSARHLLKHSHGARKGLIAAAAGGLLLHILMDYLNSYGVHPFYPFDARWFYGDLLFILEPVFWVAFGVPLAWMVRPRLLRAGLLGTILAILLWAGARGYLQWGSLLALVLGGCALAWLQHRSGPDGRRALVAALCMAGAFIGVQAWSSTQARSLIAARIEPGSRLLDTSLTGFPSNPLCWMAVSIERIDGAGIYRIRHTHVMLPPARSCPAGFAERNASGVSDTSLDQLRVLSQNCHVHAWLRFARMPVLGLATASDVRFPLEQGWNFTTLALDNIENLPCPAGVPAWTRPRVDLLTEP
jgi:inner membrane protein